MPSPIGDNAYKGLAVPLYGESQIAKQSTDPALTFTHSSANAGRFIMGRDIPTTGSTTLREQSSAIANLAVFDIDEDGGYRVVSGTTVLLELNSSGLYDGTTQILTADGVFPAARVRKNVVTVAAASTRYSVESSLSGSLFIVSTQVADVQWIVFSTVVSRGDVFEFSINSTAAGIVRFISSGSTGPQFHAQSLTTDSNVTTAGVQTATTGFAFLRFTCIDSTLASWVVESQIGFSSETTGATMIAENFTGNLIVASTST